MGFFVGLLIGLFCGMAIGAVCIAPSAAAVMTKLLQIANGTVDEQVMDALRKKDMSQAALMAALAERRAK